MEKQNPKRHSASPRTSSIGRGRRRVITGMGALAAASWLPSGARAQSTVETEIVMIGGGMAGCATALQLARHGRDVSLLERGEIASEASGQNMGGCGGAGWGNKPNLLSYLTAGSMEIFRELQLDLGYDMEFRQAGSMTAIHTEEQYDYIQAHVAQLKSGGYDGEILSFREARATEPELNPELLGCMYLPGRGQADLVKSTRAFADAARKAGASLNTGQNVSSIAVRGDGSYSPGPPNENFVAGPWCSLPVRGAIPSAECSI